MFVLPDDVDKRFCWPPGRAKRLARRGLIPHVVLPDGGIRFEWSAIEATVKRVGDSDTDADDLARAGESGGGNGKSS